MALFDDRTATCWALHLQARGFGKPSSVVQPKLSEVQARLKRYGAKKR